MKKKIVSGILIILIIISKIFVIVNAANVNEINMMQNTNNVSKSNTVVEHAQNPQKSDPVKGADEYISEDDLIYSNKYLVKGKEITRIEPKTSIKEFKKNIEIAKGNEIKIYKGKEEITSGYIGTGMTIKGTNEEEYTLSVIGDISRRWTSKPNRTNNDNPSLNKSKRMGTKRNKKRISRHKPETEK